ncbi:DUF930 domain-containing protein [Kaistia sp. UC242_56]|jgi:hypothetical protein|uniref:DUF930 domain-containing protein n=1 Tax=Kaistia sp. UC242_56 TaxID=3374625 RepID=UPI00338CAAB7|nr:DUF930 domain-containing protein [Kaistia sp.]
MRRLALILPVLMAALPGSALAADPGLAASLKELDATTRLIQVCDIAVMDKTSSRKDGVTDRAFIDMLHRPEIEGDVAVGDGGAFRRKGEWYEFSYRCAVTPDHMQTTKLSVNSIRHVPHSEWEAKNFYP